MKNIVEKIVNIIYPIKCIECRNIGDKCFCKRCRTRLGFEYRLHCAYYNNGEKYFTKHIVVQ